MNNNIQTANSNMEQTIASPSQIEQFKSIYYLLKGKRDTDIKLFHELKSLSTLKLLNLMTKYIGN
ncbi:MAG: hypothetical protein V4580_16995 [Bacteroidota bacterium]